MRVDEWFPRCYDLTEAGGVEELIEDTERTAAMIVVRKAFEVVNSIEATRILMTEAHNELEALRKKKGMLGVRDQLALLKI